VPEPKGELTESELDSIAGGSKGSGSLPNPSEHKRIDYITPLTELGTPSKT
jgi:hypothetical protein